MPKGTVNSAGFHDSSKTCPLPKNFDQMLSVEPEEILDSIEDLIREAAHPYKLDRDTVERLAKCFQDNSDLPDGEITSEQRRIVLAEFLEKFHPNEWTLVNWWAIHFAAHSRMTEGVSPADLCRVFGINREMMSYYVKKWRKTFRLSPNPDLRRESIRLAHKHRRQQTP